MEKKCAIVAVHINEKECEILDFIPINSNDVLDRLCYWIFFFKINGWGVFNRLVICECERKFYRNPQPIGFIGDILLNIERTGK